VIGIAHFEERRNLEVPKALLGLALRTIAFDQGEGGARPDKRGLACALRKSLLLEHLLTV